MEFEEIAKETNDGNNETDVHWSSLEESQSTKDGSDEEVENSGNKA